MLSEEKEEQETLLSDSIDLEDRAEPSKRSRWVVQWTLIVIVAITSLVIGFSLGRIKNQAAKFGLAVPPGVIQTQWHHNFTFTQRPNASSEAAWNSIIPVGRGFIHHPQLAPFVSNIAVFHQLHCLHAIVVAYYDALASPAISLTDVPDFDEGTGTRTAPFHIRHCFDYLRQTLMCAADTNLEVLDPVTHTTNGWNQTKVCRDYAAVKRFAERWANSSDTGITA